MHNKYCFFIDGSCLQNNKRKDSPGGFGIVVSDGDYNVIDKMSGKITKSTSDRSELYAYIVCMEFISKNEIDPNICIIFSDSSYVVNGQTAWLDGWIKNKWRKANGQPVKNQDLWKRIAELSSGLSGLSLRWVRSHSGIELNELADQLAYEAACMKG